MVTRHLGAVAVVCGAIMLLFGVAPVGASTTGNRLVNPGAENGLGGWQGVGYGVAGYDEDAIPRFPAPNFAPTPWELGARLFSAGQEAAIWQVVDFADVAGAIDVGAQYLRWGGLLGGRGGQAGGARLVVQPLDAAGAALGEPFVVGNPSDRDRRSRTALLPCGAETAAAPVGMRAAVVRLDAVGHGLADELHLTAVRLPSAEVAPPLGGFRGAVGPGCATGERLTDYGVNPIATSTRPPASPIPQLRSLVVLPAANRCGRSGPLRFRVQAAWRSRVRSIEVRARGTRIVRSADRPIVVVAPRHILRVTIAVRMRDGRARTGMQRFSGCGR